MCRHLPRLSVALSALCVAGAGMAQTVPAAPDADGIKLEEIIVTGEKRESNLQRAAVAITAVDAGTLAAGNITQINQLDGLVPSLVAPRNGTPLRVLSIRGVGSEATQTGTQPSVAYHLDGVYIPDPIALAVDVLDVSRIEVLRGPQGTIFGQAATGGAMNVISTAPQLGRTSGSAELGGGNHDYLRAFAAINVPVGETLAVRAAGERLYHDSYARLTNGYGEDNADRWNGRVSLLWQPSPDISALVRVQHFEAHENGSAQKNIFDPIADPRRLTQDFHSLYRLNFTVASATLEWKLPWATLHSISSYQRQKNDNNYDSDRLDFATYGGYDHVPLWHTTYRAYTQELNLTSLPGSRLEWIAGLFYVNNNQTQNFAEFLASGPPPASFQIPVDTTNGLPADLAYSLDVDLTRKTYAAFGQLTYHFTDALRITGGLRYNRDDLRSYSLTLYGAYDPGETIRTHDRHITGRITAEYDVAPRSLLYATVSKGYKPGGANQITTPILNSMTFKAEDLTAYELGSKNRVFDDRVSLNFAGFVYNYTNLQFQQEDPVPYNGGIQNIPRSHIWGVEAEASWKATRTLRFDANVTRLDGRFTRSFIALDASRANDASLAATALGYGFFDDYTIAQRAKQVGDVKGGKPPKLPNWQGAVTLTHMLAIAGGELTSHAELIHRGKYIYRVFNDSARDVVPSYDIVNLSFSYSPAASRFAIGVTASNLLDKAGINSRYTDPFGSFVTSNEYIAPRQVVGTVRYSF